jgi:ribonuclease VapC
MFLDASAIVAAMAGEPESEAVRAALIENETVASSSIAMFEASCRLSRLLRVSIDAAYVLVSDFFLSSSVTLTAIDAAVGREAHNCASRYHHLTGHPARLNMGDCYAYAAAKTSGLKLAYKGNDFIHTDIDGVRFGPGTAAKRP